MSNSNNKNTYDYLKSLLPTTPDNIFSGILGNLLMIGGAPGGGAFGGASGGGIIGEIYSSPKSLTKAALEGAPNYNNNTMWDKAQTLKGWGYDLGAKVTPARLKNGRKLVDCSGFVSYVLGIAAGSWQILEASNNLITTLKLETSKLKNGDVIGLDSGLRGSAIKGYWDAGRRTGIDHVMIIIENPNDKKLYFCESTGGVGVKIQPIEDGVEYYNKYAQRNRFGDTYTEKTIRKTKQFYVGNYKKQ
jgi:hypothetical protein